MSGVQNVPSLNDLASDYLRTQKVAASLSRALTELADTKSLADEVAADAESALAATLISRGPVYVLGVRFTAEYRDGLARVKADRIPKRHRVSELTDDGD